MEGLLSTLIRHRVPHLILLILLICLLQPSPLPAPLLTTLEYQLTTSETSQEPLVETVNDINLMYPDWDDPIISGVQMALRSNNPQSAFQILGDHGNNSIVEDSCINIQLYLALEDPEKAASAWQKHSAPCRFDNTILAPLVEYYLGEGDFESAVLMQSEATELSPQDPAGYISLARIYSVYHPEKALAPLQVARSLSAEEDPFILDMIRTIEDSRFEESDAYTLAEVGVLYVRRAEWEYASWALSNAVHLEPDYVEALAYLGYVQDQTGKDGLAMLEKAISLDPQNSLPAIFLADHWIRNKESDKAFEAVGTAYRLDPDNPVVAAMQGEIYAQLGDHDSAGAAYLKACELEPDIPDFWILLSEYSLMYEVKVKLLGIRAARNAVLLKPHDAHALDLLGFAHYLSGSFDVAERVLQRALSSNPTYTPALFHMGLTLLELGESSEAVSYIEQAAALEPDSYFGILAARTLETVRQP